MLGGAAAACLLLSALGLHGFSLPWWHQPLGEPASPEVLLGEPRLIRGDDWGLQLPLALAQRAHDPPFPVVNENLATGQNMLVPLPLPVAHPTALFRPTYWGFFLGADLGLSWMWWSQVFLLFSSWLLVFWIVTDGRLGLSAAGSTLLVVSPFFQFWSFAAAPAASFMGLCFVASVGLAGATGRRAALGFGALLGWAGGAFVLTIYPPYAITLAYLFLLLLAGTLWEYWPRLDLRSHAAVGRSGLALALLIAGAGVGSLLIDAGSTILAMAGTEYPGSRVETGGDAPAHQLASAHLATGLRVSDWSPLDNVCVSSSFWLLFPVTAAGFLLDARLRRRRVDRVFLALASCGALVLFFRHVGLPEAVAKLTLWSAVPPKRTSLLLGLVDTLLLMRFLAAVGASLPVARAALVSAGFAALVALAAVLMHRQVEELGLAASALLVMLNGLVAYLVLRRERPALLVAAMAAGLACCTLWFNPLVPWTTQRGSGSTSTLPGS